MSIAFVQSKSAQSAAAASITTPAMTSTSGNNLVAGCGSSTITGVTGSVITDSKSNTWTNAWRQNGASSSCGACFYAENITGGASHTVTYTPSGGSIPIAVAVGEFSGLKNNNSLDQAASTHATTYPRSSGPVTTTSSNELLVGVGTSGHVGTPKSTLNFVDVVALPDNSPEGVIFTYGIVSAIDTFLYSYQYSTSGFKEVVGIATFKGTTIAFVQSKSAQTTGATSITTAAFTSTSGNFLGAVAADNARSFSGSPFSDSKSNTWSNAWVKNGTSSDFAGCYYAENITGGASHTVTFTPVGGSDTCAMGVGEFSGINTSSSIDQTATNESLTQPHVGTRTAATAQANELILGGASQSHDSTTPISTGFNPAAPPFTDAVSLAGSTTIEGIVLSYQIVSSSGTYTFYYQELEGPTVFETCGIATFSAPGGGPSQGANPGKGGGKKGGPGSSVAVFGPSLDVSWSDINYFGGN